MTKLKLIHSKSAIETLRCYGCKKEKPIAEFNNSSLSNTNRCRRCRACVKKDKYGRKQRIREAIRAIKLHYGCQICGYNRLSEALDCHHLDPSKKGRDLSSNITSWNQFKKEIQKCVILCRVCHAEVHAGVRSLAEIKCVTLPWTQLELFS